MIEQNKESVNKIMIVMPLNSENQQPNHSKRTNRRSRNGANWPTETPRRATSQEIGSGAILDSGSTAAINMSVPAAAGIA
ncbi:MAG: hypothetical protein IIA67_11245 [Planctomycetes bacterium]|nr:hypothetical protein [Planctomycetota bacterium]